MDVTEFNFDTLSQRLRATGVLEQGSHYHPDRRARGACEIHEFHYSGGSPSSSGTSIKQAGAAREADPLRSRPRPAQWRTLTMEIALQYNDGYFRKHFSFANNINTVDGGAQSERFP